MQQGTRLHYGLNALGIVCVPACLVAVAFYAIGLPAAAALALRGGMGLAGLWTGLDVGIVCSTVSMFAFLMLRVDWRAAADYFAERTEWTDP